MTIPAKTFICLAMVLVACAVSQVQAEVYHWVDESGAVNFSDDPARAPESARSSKEEPVLPSWVMIAENISGYIYKSWGFYDENGTTKVSSNEWLVPVKLIIDNSGLGGIDKTSYLKQSYRILCSPRSAAIILNETVNGSVNQIPDSYSRYPSGAVYHESLIPDHLLDIFCGVTPESVDNTRAGGSSPEEEM
jgi:hypothetical protein